MASGCVRRLRVSYGTVVPQKSANPNVWGISNGHSKQHLSVTASTDIGKAGVQMPVTVIIGKY